MRVSQSENVCGYGCICGSVATPMSSIAVSAVLTTAVAVTFDTAAVVQGSFRSYPSLVVPRLDYMLRLGIVEDKLALHVGHQVAALTG